MEMEILDYYLCKMCNYKNFKSTQIDKTIIYDYEEKRLFCIECGEIEDIIVEERWQNRCHKKYESRGGGNRDNNSPCSCFNCVKTIPKDNKEIDEYKKYAKDYIKHKRIMKKCLKEICK